MAHCAIELFDLENVFKGKNTYDQGCLFNQTIFNIFYKFYPNKLITCNEKDPPLFHNEVGQTMNNKNEVYRYIRNGILQYNNDCLVSISNTLVGKVRKTSKESSNYPFVIYK